MFLCYFQKKITNQIVKINVRHNLYQKFNVHLSAKVHVLLHRIEVFALFMNLIFLR